MLRIVYTRFLLGVVCLPLAAKPLELQISAESAILMNPANAAILFEKNAHTQRFPASTTKLATALYVLEHSGDRLNEPVTADRESLASVSYEAKQKSHFLLPAYWLEPGGTHIGLKNGESLPLKDLLRGMLVASGNDAANLLAKEIGGSIPDFIENLNLYLKGCGCRSTHFLNPHGLHHPKHVTTAYDLAIIAQAAIKHPFFNEVVGSLQFKRPQTNKQGPALFNQTNRLLHKKHSHYYPKAIGGKTGYTAAAGNTLVAIAKQKGRTLIAVVLKCPSSASRYEDVINLFETAFREKLVRRWLVHQGPQPYLLNHSDAALPISTYVEKDLVIKYYPAEAPQLRGELVWQEIHFPVQPGQMVGEIQILNDADKVVRSVPLLAQEYVPTAWGYWLKNLFR